MGKLCGLFGKTRQGWYEVMSRKDEERVFDTILFYELKRIREGQPPEYSGRLVEDV